MATAIFAQKKQIKKANDFYKHNQYKDAIDLYEQVLEEKFNLSLSTKLAYCYRMTNQMDKAEEWYAKVTEEEKAKPITQFYYAESLMSNGKYDEAKGWFLRYLDDEPDDENARRMAFACEKVKTLEPYFKNVEIKSFEHNSEADESSPLYFNEGIVFSSDRSSGPNPLKQKSGWTGRDYQRIYFSAKRSDGSYHSPVNFSKKINDLNKHSGPVSFTKDNKTIVFSRTGYTTGKNNTYNIQLYSASSDDGNKWKAVDVISFCNKDHNYMHPAISPDGKLLFFVSDKPGGLGGTDIYVSERKGDGWGKPENAGPIINTSANEAFPYFHESGKLFFSSKGHLSFGGFDILFSTMNENKTWTKPVNVGKPINSSYDDISISLDSKMETGLFSSSRDGGDDDIYFFKVIEGNYSSEIVEVEKMHMPKEDVEKEMESSIPDQQNSNTPIAKTDSLSKKTSLIIPSNELEVITDNPESDSKGNGKSDQENNRESKPDHNKHDITKTVGETSEKGNIRDERLSDTPAPSFIGDEKSALTDEVYTMPKLAELLQTNQAIPSTGFIVNGLKYPEGSFLLSPVGTRSLAAVIDLMDKYPSLKIEIGSHTPSPGNDVENHNLSRKRAMSIKAFLVYKGVASDRLRAKAYGETQLLNTCANGVECTQEEHIENDRIEIKVIE